MNAYQELWWHQARSDLDTLELLRRHGSDPCHQLHYLQMVSEKLGKAYFWRSGFPPPRSHATFVPFLRSIGSVRQSRQEQITKIFAFKSYAGFQSWTNSVLPIAYDLERLAPALAQNGPNPEYPWPPDAPTDCPIRYSFPIWDQLTRTTAGRQLTQIIKTAVERLPAYG